MAQHDGRVVIVGAGLVGLACAYSLAVEGRRTLLVEAAGAAGGASERNAGWITFGPEIVAPVASPGVPATAIKWLLSWNSPLRVTPRFDPEYVRWLRLFVGACSPEVAAAGLKATLAFNATTAELFDALADDGLQFEMRQRGTLVVYRNARSFASARRRIVEHGREGADQVLSRDETLAAEPLLRPDCCLGAIRYDGDRQIKPDQLASALVSRLRTLGAEIHEHCPCDGFVTEGRHIVAVRTKAGLIDGTSFVLAAGTSIGRLLKSIGVRIPVEGGRGYSYDVDASELPVSSAIYLHEGRVAITPFSDVTRISGMMELGARRASVRARGIAAINQAGAASLRTWPARPLGGTWAGLRPMTPDGLPVIGLVQGFENLFVAGGHGMLGVTLSLRTGASIATAIRDGGSDASTRAFSATRFSRASCRQIS